MSSQLPLPFGNFDRYSFEIFVPGRNREAVDDLKRLSSGGAGGIMYLWGGHGTGKSHLLQAACGQSSRSRMKPAYIPLAEHGQLVPDILGGLESLDLVCIDDLDAVSGEPAWEMGLFNLFNALMENGKSMVVVSHASPAGSAIALADLKSRLSSGITYHLHYPDEDERLRALKQRAGIRGFELSDEVIDYLTRRIARDMHTLFDWLDRLDEASLISKRRLTVSLVRELLEKNA